MPTLLVWGKQDRVVPVATAETYRNALGKAEIITFPQCGHRPEFESREGFLEAVRGFLA